MAVIQKPGDFDLASAVEVKIPFGDGGTSAHIQPETREEL